MIEISTMTINSNILPLATYYKNLRLGSQAGKFVYIVIYNNIILNITKSAKSGVINMYFGYEH